MLKCGTCVKLYSFNLVQDWSKCDLGCRFGSLKLKFDMLIEWNGLIDNVVEMYYLCEVIALIHYKNLVNAI